MKKFSEEIQTAVRRVNQYASQIRTGVITNFNIMGIDLHEEVRYSFDEKNIEYLLKRNDEKWRIVFIYDLIKSNLCVVVQEFDGDEKAFLHDLAILKLAL